MKAARDIDDSFLDITVVVPAHKAGKWLPTSLESVLTQVGEPGQWLSTKARLVVALNGTPDPGWSYNETLNYLGDRIENHKEQFSSEFEREHSEWDVLNGDPYWGDSYPYPWWKVQVVEVAEANKSVALNAAVLQAARRWADPEREFICVCDADDVWTPDKLWSQIKFLKENPEVDVLGTRFQYVDEHMNPLPNTPELPLGHQEIVEALDRGENLIANSSVCYRASLHRFGLYDPLNRCEDYEWWKRLRESGATFANLPLVGMLHRIHKGSHFNGSRQQEVYKSFTDNCYKVHQTMRGVP